MTNTTNNMGSPYKALYINVGESFLQWLTCEATRRSHQRFVGKWCLRKEGRNSILMACHCSGQDSASDWLKHISLVARAIPIKSTALIWDRSSLWNFCAGSSDAILRGNRWLHHEMSAVSSGLWNLEEIPSHRKAQKSILPGRFGAFSQDRQIYTIWEL